MKAGRRHTEIQRNQQVEFSFRCFVVPSHFLRLFLPLDAEVLTQNAVAGTEEMLQEIFVPFSRRTQQIGTPYKHVARPVRGIVRVVAR